MRRERMKLSWKLLAVFLIAQTGRVPGQNLAQVKECSASPSLGDRGFQSVLETVATGWNQGNARLAASCFAEDAIFSGPPSVPHRGRKELYEWFGGERGRALPMRMTWHHILFDTGQQIGVGEFTFKYQIQTHGLVIVRMSNGLILNWREYEIESPLTWERFVADNRF
jgi:hypothetical protein